MNGFHTTRWSLITATQGDAAQAGRALEELCRAYRPPVLAFIRRSGCRNTDAEDLAQSFFLGFLEHTVYARADPARGRFRGLLLTALRRFLIDQRDMATAGKRGQSLIVDDVDIDDCAAIDPQSPEQFFAREWMATVLARAIAKLQDEWERKGKGDQFRELETILVERADPNEVRALAARTGARPNTLTVQAHRMRLRLRELVRLELMQTVGSAEALETELAELRGLMDAV